MQSPDKISKGLLYLAYVALVVNIALMVEFNARLEAVEAFQESYRTNPVCDWAAKKLRSKQNDRDWLSETESQKESKR